MDNLRYIDLKTYEILDNPVGYIPCDKEISDIIALLNKKGYITKSSCAGHNHISYNNGIEILGESTYIVFDKNYDFSNLPEEFTYENGHLYKLVDYYDDASTNRKTSKEIENELNNNWNSLRNWANKL